MCLSFKCAWRFFIWSLLIIGIIASRIMAASPTHTPTMTVTASPTNTGADIIWSDDFSGGTPGIQPSGWQDETDTPAFNAEMFYSYTVANAALTRTAEDVWGKSLSPVINCDAGYYNAVEIRIVDINPLTTWKVGIQEINGAWQHQDLCTSKDTTGTFIFEYASVMGWSGTKNFSIQLTIEGGSGDYVVVDYVNVRRLPITATPTHTRTTTPTVTPSLTPTGPTDTPTATPTAAVLTADFWFTGFEGTTGIQPSGWQDESNDGSFNAEIVYASSQEAVTIVRTAEDVWGKVLSPAICCDVNAYPRVAITVNALSPTTSWKISCLEYGTSNQWDLCTSQTGTGAFEFNYAQITGLFGEKQAVFQLIIEGAAGTWVEVDQIQVMGNRRMDTDFTQVNAIEPDQLSIQGTVVKIKGANYYPSTHGWQKMWLEWEPELIHAELARTQMLGINMIRACIHYSEFGGPDVKPEMLARMEEFLYIAAKNNLQVEFSFFPYFRDYSPAVRQDMKNHVGTILARFQNDSRIFGWGMTNELDVHVALLNGDMPAHSDALDWFHDMAAFMQSTDPNHLVIAPTSWPDTMRSLDLSMIDVYSLHYYGPLEAYQGNMMRTRVLMIQQDCVKPILLEEFGLDYNTNPTETEVSDYFTLVWDAIYQTDIAGGVVWILNDTEQDGTPHLWGIYTASGIMRDGVAIIASAYTGSDLYAPILVGRPASSVQTQYPVFDQETVFLNSQLPQVEAKWTPEANRADHQAQDGGVLIYNIVRGAETYGYGHIKTVYAVDVNMDEENDLRINIKDLFGRWYAFLGNTPTGYQIRLQYDSPVKGAFVYNLKDYVPDSLKNGQQYFTLAIGGVEAMYCMDVANVLVENVSVAAGARPTPAATPIDTYWMEQFNGTMWVQPEGWRDETEDSTFNCQIAYSAASSHAVISRTAQDSWGKVFSPVLQCNVDTYNQVEVVVTDISPAVVWRVGIQENGGSGSNWDLCPDQTQSGTFRFSIPDATGLSGQQQFNIQMSVVGASGSYCVLDAIRLNSVPSTPTPTMTISPTLTVTPTLADTVTITPTPWMPEGQVMAYPNPARDYVNFAYTVSGSIKTVIDIYQVAGERVGHIVEHHYAGSGQTVVTQWHTTDLAPSIYFSRIVITDASGKVILKQMKKVAIIK
ncbi:cellulase family glycosylhydrolase [bacterium]|nr:cellulase family glycosylhydrolase [bacterium]